MVLRKREKPIARIFHVAYLAQSRAARPLTFVFNGGPGAASAYLHMRHWGPQRAVFNEAGLLTHDLAGAVGGQYHHLCVDPEGLDHPAPDADGQLSANRLRKSHPLTFRKL